MEYRDTNTTWQHADLESLRKRRIYEMKSVKNKNSQGIWEQGHGNQLTSACFSNVESPWTKCSLVSALWGMHPVHSTSTLKINQQQSPHFHSRSNIKSCRCEWNLRIQDETMTDRTRSCLLSLHGLLRFISLKLLLIFFIVLLIGSLWGSDHHSFPYAHFSSNAYKHKRR